MLAMNELLPGLDLGGRALGDDVFVGKHRISESGVFDRANLIKFLDSHPEEDLGISTMGDDPTRPGEWRDGDRGGLSGRALLEAVESGRLWLNLRRATQNHIVISDVVNQLYSELEQSIPGLTTFNHTANLLISSPTAIVYYHMDCPFNMLWHIEGTKRVWAYPTDERFLPMGTREDVLFGECTEEIHYEQEFDEHARVVDLEPGEFITWPLHSPHRVVNTSGINVSLSTEHYTKAVLRQNNVYLANRYFRNWHPRFAASHSPTGFSGFVKENAIRLIRRMPGLAPQSSRRNEYPKSFVVDFSAEDCVRPLGVQVENAPALV